MTQNGVKQEPSIKDEPDVQIKQEPGMSNYGFNGVDDKHNVAANRAAHLVQQAYGGRGTGSINAIQDNVVQHHQPQLQQDGYSQQGFPLPQEPNLGQGQPGSAQNAQLDGAADLDDFEAVLMRRGAAGELEELGRIEVDSLLHQHIAANAKSMEGGGLMVTLKEATKHKAGPSVTRKGKGVGAYDGVDDDEDLEENDEDAINSDLDDDDDAAADEEAEDEGLGSIMLCMYDKVQRVKNKW